MALYGSTANAIDVGVPREQRDRLRLVNEGTFLIERHRVPLTKGDVQRLFELADDGARGRKTWQWWMRSRVCGDWRPRLIA